MFEALGTAVDDLEIPVDGDALVEVLSIYQRLGAKVTAAIGEFDHAGLWDVDAATSMTAWLKDRCARSGPDAHRLVGRAKKLHRLPVTAAVTAAAALTPAQLDVILANVSSRHLALFAEHETELIPTLVGLSLEATATAMEKWRDLADQDDAVPPEPAREFHCSRTLNSRRVLKGHLDAEPGAVVDTALRLATSKDCEGEPARTASEKRADALVDICRFFLDYQQTRRGGRHRPHLNVIIDLEAVEAALGHGQLLDGTIIGIGDVGRLLCDGNLHRVVITNKSSILDYGTTIHTAPAPLFAAVAVRDRHCRWPGCDRPAHWCEAHHVWHWTNGGPTRIDNLVLLCSRHHHRLHRPGWHAKLLPDATFEITTPEGRVLTSHPPIRGPSG